LVDVNFIRRVHIFLAKEKKKRRRRKLIGLFLMSRTDAFRQKISLPSALENRKNNDNKTSDRHDLRDLFALFARGAFSFAREEEEERPQ